jgi:Tol biopolymer transport system component
MSPQESIGHYTITSKLGEGGMGAVYRATDTKLNREVALKVLPEAFAADPDRMARFEREAQMLAALNHPNIAAIYGIEQGAIVMELVEGETPSGKIPIETALAYARQIATALEAAHEKGIIHRDLKPANIKVTPDGVVKLLDFGLAKATEETAGNPANSPTMSLTMTQAGVILGTAAYMSPEQARGKMVDKRSDIWAFGVVLFEMLTGRALYGGGETVTDTIAAVVTREPDWSALPADTPPRVRRLLERCLRKDSKQRLRDIGEARVILDEPETAAPAVSEARSSKLPWIAATALAVAAAAAGAGWWRASQPERRMPMRFDVSLGPDAVAGDFNGVAISPDGSRLMYAHRAPDGQMEIVTRQLDRARGAPVAGSAMPGWVLFPAFSPDGNWIATYARGQILKFAIQGGAPAALCAATDVVLGLDWSDPDFVLFAATDGRIMRVPAAGGEARILTDPKKTGDIAHGFPQTLPGGKVALFTGLKRVESESAEIKAVNVASGEIRTVHRGGALPRFVPSGHLIYQQGGSLFAARFDPVQLELRGTPTLILDDVTQGPTGLPMPVSISRTGTLVYVAGKGGSGKGSIASMQEDGKTTPLVSTEDFYIAPAFSPNGKRLAYSQRTGRGMDVWVYDLERQTPTQLTFDANRVGAPEVAWTPDGAHLVYTAMTAEGPTMFWVRADGSEQPRKLVEGRPHSFSPDGRTLIYTIPRDGIPDLWTVTIDASDPEHPKAGKPEAFLNTPAVEVDGMFSPDGRWVAYASSESGREEMFVRPFPPSREGGGKVRVSTAGGKFPSWSRTARELFFLGEDNRIMVATYTVSPGGIEFTKPRVWSERPVRRTLVFRSLDLHPDGKRFAVLPLGEEELKRDRSQVTVILNFFEELKRRVP